MCLDYAKAIINFTFQHYNAILLFASCLYNYKTFDHPLEFLECVPPILSANLILFLHLLTFRGDVHLGFMSSSVLISLCPIFHLR